MHIKSYIPSCSPLTQDTISLIIALEKKCFSTFWKHEQFIAAFSQKHYKAFGIQNIQNALIGYISLYIIHEEIEIITIAVDPQMRQKGYGKQLLYTVLQYGISAGSTNVYLEVNASNTPAIRLYESFGFSKNGIRYAYYNDTKDNALLYSRSLSPHLPIVPLREFS